MSRSTCRRRCSNRCRSDVAKKRKLLAAVLDTLGARCKHVRQRTTVMPADFPVCDMLKIPFASPVAKMSRRLLDGKGNVLYAGLTWYRGDRFVSEIDFPVSALKTMPGITEPQPRAAAQADLENRYTTFRVNPDVGVSLLVLNF